jgi:hypothetical protein
LLIWFGSKLVQQPCYALCDGVVPFDLTGPAALRGVLGETLLQTESVV